MKNILVPCDFSKPAVNAFRFALRIAIQTKASVYLIHAIELPVLNSPEIISIDNFEDAYLKELIKNSKKQFDELKGKFESEGLSVEIVSSVEFGPPSFVILEYVKHQSIDLIIMGSHGVSGLREVFVGSNTEKIVRRSPVPVLVVKNHFKGSIQNIVFPNTLEIEHQEDLVMKVKALQEFFQAKLHLVFINTLVNFTDDQETYQRLEAFAKHFELKNFTLNIYNNSDAEEGILQFSKRVNANIIAMATYGHRGITHLLSGSLAEDIANHTDMLVWTYSLRNQLIEA